MLDIRLIREQPDFVKARLATRGGSDAGAAIDEILACDGRRRRIETELQTHNAGAQQAEQGDRRQARPRRAHGGPRSAKCAAWASASLRSIWKRPPPKKSSVRLLLNASRTCRTPAAPIGRDAADNPVVRVWGEKPPTFLASCAPEDHLRRSGARLGLFDLERAAKISGSGFVCFTGRGRAARAGADQLFAGPARRPARVRGDRAAVRHPPGLHVRHERNCRSSRTTCTGWKNNALFLTPDGRGARHQLASRGDPGRRTRCPKSSAPTHLASGARRARPGRETRGLIRRAPVRQGGTGQADRARVELRRVGRSSRPTPRQCPANPRACTIE